MQIDTLIGPAHQEASSACHVVLNGVKAPRTNHPTTPPIATGLLSLASPPSIGLSGARTSSPLPRGQLVITTWQDRGLGRSRFKTRNRRHTTPCARTKHVSEEVRRQRPYTSADDQGKVGRIGCRLKMRQAAHGGERQRRRLQAHPIKRFVPSLLPPVPNTDLLCEHVARGRRRRRLDRRAECAVVYVTTQPLCEGQQQQQQQQDILGGHP